jgi:hypothetical protein
VAAIEQSGGGSLAQSISCLGVGNVVRRGEEFHSYHDVRLQICMQMMITFRVLLNVLMSA